MVADIVIYKKMNQWRKCQERRPPVCTVAEFIKWHCPNSDDPTLSLFVECFLLQRPLSDDSPALLCTLQTWHGSEVHGAPSSELRLQLNNYISSLPVHSSIHLPAPRIQAAGAIPSCLSGSTSQFCCRVSTQTTIHFIIRADGWSGVSNWANVHGFGRCVGN